MHYNYTQFNGPQFRLLSDSQLEELHMGVLQILERTGVAFECPEAIELLDGADADVSDPNRVKIPSYLVEQALRTAPKMITLYSRDGEPAIVLNGMTGPHFGSAPDPREIRDPYTGERRTCLPCAIFSVIGQVASRLSVTEIDSRWQSVGIAEAALLREMCPSIKDWVLRRV